MWLSLTECDFVQPCQLSAKHCVCHNIIPHLWQVKRVRDYMKDPKFTVDDIKSISTAGAGLLKWVFAMVNYYRYIWPCFQLLCELCVSGQQVG